MKATNTLVFAIAFSVVGGVLAQSPQDASKRVKSKSPDQLEGIIYQNFEDRTLGISGYQIRLAAKAVVPSNWDVKTGKVVIGGNTRFRVRGTIVKDAIIAAEIVRLGPPADATTPASAPQ